MDDNDRTGMDPTPDSTRRRRPPLAAAIGLLLAGGLAGGIIAATNSASATDDTSATSSTSASSSASDDRGGGREGETELTGTNAATARAAALKAVPGGTVDRLETDADGAVYEAHMTKADGTRVTVKLDKDFKVTATEEGHGRGGPGRDGGSTPGTSGASI
jgi:hypothetical protein